MSEPLIVEGEMSISSTEPSFMTCACDELKIDGKYLAALVFDHFCEPDVLWMKKARVRITVEPLGDEHE